MYCAYFHFGWVPPYNLVQKGQGINGYIVADPLDNPDCDVPICYCSQVIG